LTTFIQVPGHIGNGLGVGEGGGVHLASSVYRIALNEGLAEILSVIKMNSLTLENLALTFSAKHCSHKPDNLHESN
jgi:hypothetical protein